MKPKIALIFAGGTIGMIKDPHSGILHPAKDIKDLINFVPELVKQMEVTFIPLFNIDSSDMMPAHWTQIADKIGELYNNFDGFVVAQGTDTMAYSSSALAFALQNLSKPVILTGSIVPITELGADGRNNLIYACLTASLNIAEVCIVFGCKIIRGCRAKKNHESFVDVFHSPNFPLLGEIERPIKLFNWRIRRSKKKLKLKSSFESNIRLVKLFPGFDPKSLNRMMDAGAKGLIIEGFGPGNIPVKDSSLLSSLKLAKKRQIPVVITSQMEHSITNLETYEGGWKALKEGVISAKDMTVEATLTKLMWILAQTQDLAKIKALMIKNLAGELSE